MLQLGHHFGGKFVEKWWFFGDTSSPSAPRPPQDPPGLPPPPPTPLQISVSKVPHDKSLRVKKGMPD